ncbi:restriction endonuclease subunit S [Tenacibaculum sp. 1_MG-2023]|uniref:restriction endonuclease subunit S n=1 Tax=Tenacibaculum sp. 1_MG-2023 TaxID=3062653 RepID=UPI0026E42E4D|nr:restriction endonuclease subunit S [Tenacibaculum sp. 1_MG-2023]MDO6676900.1 restriction endonuclease subunit S [Tenacibaculum sp. 1_MG-2023]
MKDDWTECCFEDLLDYEQPTKYIVKSTKYNDSYKMPVLTAGKTFIKGYTNETDGIFDNLPTIIFDDFTTAMQYVNFKFKVKSSAMKILVPTSKLVNMPLVYYAMQVNQVRSDTHKRYWISVFAKKKFLLPPLVEQKEIVKKIEALFSSLDSGIADLKKAQEQLKIYRQAVLKKAFEGEYPQKKIIEIADVKTGATPKRGNAKYWENGTIPWVTSTVVNDEFVNQSSELITETAIKETNCKLIPKGSLLMAMYGEGKTRGKCSELNIDTATNQALAAITLLEENKESKKFLKLFLLKNYEEIRLLSSGGVQPNLNLTIVKNTVIPFPSLKEQHQIVKGIESRLSVCDKVEKDIADSLEKAQALRQSILKKAFEGKLLSEAEIAACKQHPDYEPASVLLEKIKAEKRNNGERTK